VVQPAHTKSCSISGSKPRTARVANERQRGKAASICRAARCLSVRLTIGSDSTSWACRRAVVPICAVIRDYEGVTLPCRWLSCRRHRMQDSGVAKALIVAAALIAAAALMAHFLAHLSEPAAATARRARACCRTSSARSVVEAGHSSGRCWAVDRAPRGRLESARAGRQRLKGNAAQSQSPALRRWRLSGPGGAERRMSGRPRVRRCWCAPAQSRSMAIQSLRDRSASSFLHRYSKTASVSIERCVD
jgi:hypothetical protein